MHIRKSPVARRGSEATNVECNVSLELLQVIFLPLHIGHTFIKFKFKSTKKKRFMRIIITQTAS
jgi:hypothetical protein